MAADRDRLASVLAAWASAGPYRIVVTTRPVEGTALAPLHRIGAARYELLPFDAEALRSFARHWFAEEGEETADRFLRQIRAAHLDELVRVPLLATIAAIVFARRGDLPLPDNQYELYEAYLAFLRSARTSTGPFEEFRDGLLEHLGRTRSETDTSLVSAARSWVAGHVPAVALPADWHEELTTFLVSVGPLVIRGEDLRFLHQLRREPLLDERVPLVALRALPEQLGAAVAAPRTDVRVEIEDRVAILEVVERAGADRGACDLLQAHRGGLVAHVRRIGQVVVPVHAPEELPHERGFQARAARGVELRHVWIGQRLERAEHVLGAARREGPGCVQPT